MNITPIIPDGYNGPIKQLTCRICKHLFYITQDDYRRLTDVHFCYECSLILLEELRSLQGVHALPPSMTSGEQPAVAPPCASEEPSPHVRVPQPRTIDRGKMTVEQLLEEAKMLRKTWRYREALDSYEQALQRDRNCIAAHQGRCAMLRELGQGPEALLASDELVCIDPQSASPWVGKAWALVDLRRYEEALAAFEYALQLAPSLSTAVSGKRFILQHLHRDDEAEEIGQPDPKKPDREPLAGQPCSTADDYFSRRETLLSLGQKKEVHMTSMADNSVKIQTTSASNFSTPAWFGEVVVISSYLRTQGILSKISEQGRFTRKRFGRYDVIDFLAVLFGYAISGERTLEEFYERLQPFADAFMALFDRDRLPSRSALSRFLAGLTQAPVEALRTLFLDDLLSRPLTPDKQSGGLVDRKGHPWVVIDIDGTREAARQRALPKGDELPPAFRRLDDVCAAGYTGRKRGEVVRTRTTVSQAHSYQWLGSFGNRGNGRYREELCQGLAALRRYLAATQLSQERTLLRLDGQYGTGAVLSDVAGFAFVTRGKDYNVLEHPLIQARLHLPPDQVQQRPESQTVRSLYDCPQIPVGPEGVSCRVVVATHPADQNDTEKNRKKTVGVVRAGVVYELFFTTLPQQGFTACDVVEVYLHRGAFEPVLSDEDQEIDPDRWCSHSAWGQEAWQCIAQWVWNLRLELGHHLKPEPVRTTRFAAALDQPEVGQAPAQGYGPPVIGRAWKAGRYSGQDFALQSDGTVHCPADQTLFPHEHRREADGSLRVVYGASLRSCRPCPLRDQCQWQGNATAKPRQVSVLLHPLAVGTEPLLWQDWGRRSHRRACLHLLRHQRVEIQVGAGNSVPPAIALAPLSRAERAHTRLSWQKRLARNERTSATQEVTIKLFGVPQAFALWLGLVGE